MERLQLLGRILKEDSVKLVTQDSEAILVGTRIRKNYLQRSVDNLFRAALFGYKARLRILPDEYKEVVYDYTHLPLEGSLGWNVPPMVEKYRGQEVRVNEIAQRFHKIFQGQ